MLAETLGFSAAKFDRGHEPGFGTSCHVASGAVLTLHPGQILFKAGEPKSRLYRVLDGGLSLSVRPNGQTPTGYALSGSILGLGFLDTHLETAQALAETRVECLSLDAGRDLAANDEAIAKRASEAADREFALLRERAAGSRPRTPLERVAAYLVAAAQISARSGSDPSVIHEDLRCGVLADWLGLELDEFSSALMALKRRGLIASEPGGAVRITNLSELEAVVDMH